MITRNIFNKIKRQANNSQQPNDKSSHTSSQANYTKLFSLFRRTSLYVKHNYLNDHTQYFK